MSEIHVLLRHPLEETAARLLAFLVARRREGNLAPPSVAESAEELAIPPPAARAAGEELNERRLVVLAEPGIFALLRWPRLTHLQGRGLRMALAEQLEAVGAPVPAELAEAWSQAEENQQWPPPANPATGPAETVWLALRAAHHAALEQSLAACRQATAATIEAGVVPLLARLAGWLERLMVALGMDSAPALRYELPDSANPRARELFQQGWQAELTRNRHRAQLAYVAALRADPGYHRARLRYAEVTFRLGQQEAAVAELARLVEAHERLGAAHLLCAQLRLEMAGADAAEEVERHLQAALADARADHAQARLLLSRLRLAQGRPAEALSQARQAVALEPSRAESYHTLGGALVETGDLEPAAWSYAAAVLADPDYAPAAEALFHLRQLAAVAPLVPHARQLKDESWQ
jgi:thioredoxin-like negative regulator of GroEL